MAEKIGAYGYLECSAKTKDGVREVFETATRAALQVKKKKQTKCQILWSSLSLRCGFIVKPVPCYIDCCPQGKYCTWSTRYMVVFCSFYKFLYVPDWDWKCFVARLWCRFDDSVILLLVRTMPWKAMQMTVSALPIWILLHIYLNFVFKWFAAASTGFVMTKKTLFECRSLEHYCINYSTVTKKLFTCVHADRSEFVPDFFCSTRTRNCAMKYLIQPEEKNTFINVINQRSFRWQRRRR